MVEGRVMWSGSTFGQATFEGTVTRRWSPDYLLEVLPSRCELATGFLCRLGPDAGTIRRGQFWEVLCYTLPRPGAPKF
ncbi:uncharacterized protein LOC143188561 isoform X2 [Calliopsis andreniformis]|uniref:uncharacterized protein LOC143188561 isoform X2 n=1 Tax=Calliopsis andreniformis TaxID=337506 RepID=UPI003FCC9767